MDMNIIIAPLVGAGIGYVTNAIAIKMLFRPVKPVYIGKWRLPFTPGLIPKEKARLAQSIGEAVGENLLNEEALRDALLSNETKAKLRGTLTDALERGAACEDTLLGCLKKLIGDEQAGQGVDRTRSFIADYLAERLIEADLGATAARSVTDGIKKKTPDGIADFLSKVLDGRLKQNAAQQIQTAVNGYVERHAREVVLGAVDGEAEKLLNARVCDLAQQYADRLPELVDGLVGLYEKLLTDGLERLLNAIDLTAIVRARIESTENEEIERMIFQVVDKELKAIIYLGGLLGFVMGLVTLIF